jgi:hypothetical protein
MTILHKNELKCPCATAFESVRAQFSRKIIFELKNRSWEPLAAKINFFEKFGDDVIITLNDQN